MRTSMRGTRAVSNGFARSGRSQSRRFLSPSTPAANVVHLDRLGSERLDCVR